MTSTIILNNDYFISSKSSLFLTIFKIIFGIIVIAACANISVPLKPVPITLQTAAIMLIGLTYSPRDALITCCAYTLLGVCGLPIFANFSFGLNALIGCTGGYLIGMSVAGFCTSYLKSKLSRYISKFLTNVVSGGFGSLVIFVLGVSWLSYHIGLDKALYSGFIVFIPSGICKILLVSCILRLVGK